MQVLLNQFPSYFSEPTSFPPLFMVGGEVYVLLSDSQGSALNIFVPFPFRVSPV